MRTQVKDGNTEVWCGVRKFKRRGETPLFFFSWYYNIFWSDTGGGGRRLHLWLSYTNDKDSASGHEAATMISSFGECF